MNNLTELAAIAEWDAGHSAASAAVKFIRRRSEKLPDPETLFAHWAYRIEPHHWVTLGVTKRTFVKNKKAYMAWARDVPSTYAFDQGYIFYSAGKDRYLQVVSVNSDHFEVHTGFMTPGHERHGYKVDEEELLDWLKAGRTPLETSRLFKGEGKAGAFAWMIVGPETRHLVE